MKEINIADFTYTLAPERIALHPVVKRDESKLLVYRAGTITHNSFSSLPEQLPSNAFLFFNDTKVIPARLHFTKDTGATVEIFLLSPVSPSSLVAEAMVAQRLCSWKCTVGNLKRWPEGSALVREVNGTSLEARLTDREEGIVEFRWNSSQSFAELIQGSGETPLPPYLKRNAEAEDKLRYQTVYAHHEGAVAAPTAGLHFTPEVLDALKRKGVALDFVTLHVSAGTFQPVKVSNALEHTMHREQIVVSRQNLENLLQPERMIIPVGTTSMRTLESLYWFGAKLLRDRNASFEIMQNDPYVYSGELPSRKLSLERVLKHMNDEKKEILTGETAIYIVPGYMFRVCEAIITNFHQPGSTLILLVAAFIGSDWKKVYEEAYRNDYRFLSYGDSSLLIP